VSMQINEVDSARKSAVVSVEDIIILPPRRDINDEAVATLAESIEKVGLHTPITVVERDGNLVLVAGGHRLAAFRHLGRHAIPAFVLPSSTTDQEARMWEISENLHRVELTALERSEMITEWQELAKVRKVSAPSNQQPRDQGYRETARELGIDEKAVRNAAKISTITLEAKEAAREAGIDNNQAKLLKVAAATPEKQATVAREIAGAKAPEKADPAAITAEKTVTSIKVAIGILAEQNKVFAGKAEDGNGWPALPDSILDALLGEDFGQAFEFLHNIDYAIQKRAHAAKAANKIAWEAKHPEEARAKARREAIVDAMQYDMDDAKQEAKEDGQRWSDIKEEWVAQWEADNWSDAQEAEFDTDLRRDWEQRHGKQFPDLEAA
jgi:ParB/RepB/Spo0J family partition protein